MLPTRVLRAAANGPKPNITGFNIRHMRAAAVSRQYDPWERSEAWRSQGVFTRWNRYKGALPGLGTGSALFAVYCVYEYFFLDDGHHGEGHGEEHH